MDDLFARYGQYLVPAVIVLLAVAYYADKRKDRKRKPGGRRNDSFKRPRSCSVSWNSVLAPARLKTGDNNICGQKSDGTIITAMGDMNSADGLAGSDTVFYQMDHVGATIKKLWASNGKCNGVYCDGDRVLALKSDKGSNWQGTQSVRWVDVMTKKAVSAPLNTIKGYNHLDVFATAATHGYGNEWRDNRLLLFTVNANKEKFDDYQAGIDVYIGDANAPLELGRYRAGGKIVNRQNQMVAGQRNNHTNYISVNWDNRFATYILWLSDFFAKTWECWYWDRAHAQNDISKGWQRFYRAPPADSGQWNQTFKQMGLPKTGQEPWQGDKYWRGFWGMNPVRDRKHGNLIASGGWGGPNSPFDRGIFLPGGPV